jgi:hypothetical protein
MCHYLPDGVGGYRTFTIALDDKSLTNDHAERRRRVGFSRERSGKDGKPRYVALYRDLKGRQRSAGTYASRRPDRAWQRAEARLELGRSCASASATAACAPPSAPCTLPDADETALDALAKIRSRASQC